MNEQNNNFNPSMNNQPQQPTQPVRNKFFSQDLFNDTNINDVGTPTSNMASNSVGGQVISWGVGGNSANNTTTMVSPDSVRSDKLFEFEEEEKLFDFGEEENINSVSNIETLSDEMLQDVNGVVYTQEQPEILDFDVNPQPQVDNLSVQNSAIFQQAVNNDVNNQNIQNTQNNGNVMQQQQESMPTSQNENSAANPVVYDSNLLSQQPLSMNTLGAENVVPPESLNDNQFAVNSRFFDNNMVGKNFENMKEINEFQKQQMLQSIPVNNKKSNALDSKEASLVNAYMGPKAQKLQMSPFSICSFIFGSFYFMVRKLYLIGILIYIIENVVLLFVPGLYRFIAFGFVRLMEALLFDTIYVKVVRSRVKKLERNNPKRTLYDLCRMATKKGGTSFILAFLLNGLISTVLVVGAVLILGMHFINDFKDNMISMFEDNFKVEEQKKDGIVYTDYDLSKIMNFTIPDTFVLEKGTPNKYVYNSDSESLYNTCEFSISAVSGDKNSEDLIKRIIEDEGGKEKYDSAKTGDITWYTLYTEDNKGKLYRRAADIEGKIVLFEFTSGANTPDGVCDGYIVQILDSISLKEE